MDNSYNKDLNKLFMPSESLVSPLNSPEKFLRKEYFLTDNQIVIKSKVLKNIVDGDKYISVIGRAGTGKTLLIYDIAKELSIDNKVLIIHCGKLCKGHESLNKSFSNIDIIPAKEFNQPILEDYDYVILDESQRFYITQFETLVANSNKVKTIIFSYDEEQILCGHEIVADVSNKIKVLPEILKYEFTKKIRTNPEMASFIKKIFSNKQKDNIEFYNNVKVKFTNNVAESNLLLKHYQSKGYTFINFTTSQFKSFYYDNYVSMYNTHEVICQEFDKVIMILNNRYFKYDDKGILKSSKHPNSNYFRL